MKYKTIYKRYFFQRKSSYWDFLRKKSLKVKITLLYKVFYLRLKMRFIVLKTVWCPSKNYMRDIDKYVVYKMIRKYNLKETLSLPSLSLYISLSNVFFQCSEQKTRNRIHVLCTSELFQVQAIDSYRLSVSISLHTRVGCKHWCFGWFRQ